MVAWNQAFGTNPERQARLDLKRHWMKILCISSQAAALQLSIIGSIAHPQASPIRPHDNAAACPTASMPSLFQPGKAAAAPPQIIVSSTVKSSDLSTSIVITPDPTDQIHCGRTELRIAHDVVFNEPTLSDGRTKPLKMDVLSPVSPGRRPLAITSPEAALSSHLRKMV